MTKSALSIYSRFIKFSKSGSKGIPKKEYFNALIVRKIKKQFRSMSGNKKNYLKGIDPSSKIFLKFQNIYIHNKEFLDEISRTENGPQLNGRNSRPKSFNTTYLKSFFRDKVIQESFYVMIEFMMQGDCENKSKNFLFNCCEDNQHDIQCSGKWNDLENFLKVSYLEELGVKCSDLNTEEYIPGLDLESPENQLQIFSNL